MLNMREAGEEALSRDGGYPMIARITIPAIVALICMNGCGFDRQDLVRQSNEAYYIREHHCPIINESPRWKNFDAVTGKVIERPGYKAYKCSELGMITIIYDYEVQP